MSEEGLTIDKPGIYRISNEDYHKDPCVTASLSRGVIDSLLNETPAHAWYNHPKLNSDFACDDKDPKFDLGTSAHALFLEGENIIQVCDFTSWQSNKAKEAREEAYLAGKIPMFPEQADRVHKMVKAAHRQLADSELGIQNLHAEGDSELSYIWKEGDTFCRVRPDWISHKKIGDRKLIIGYKTTSASADPARFKATDHGKDIEWAFYRRGGKAIEGGKAPRYIFMTQEVYPPYLCSFVGLDPQTQEVANQKVEYGIFLFQKCVALNDWPGYPLRIAYAESKPWEVAAWEVKAQELGND